jgi:hypothetical protein
MAPTETSPVRGAGKARARSDSLAVMLMLDVIRATHTL